MSDILAASYARLIVDEYQDSSQRQHALITWAAQALPTCVLGDPMQAIFGFGQDQLAHWDQDTCSYFPVMGELATPGAGLTQMPKPWDTGCSTSEVNSYGGNRSTFAQHHPRYPGLPSTANRITNDGWRPRGPGLRAMSVQHS